MFNTVCSEDRALAEFAQVEIVAEEEKAGGHELGFKDVLDNRWLRRIVLVGIGVPVTQQLTGINTIMYYGPRVLEQSGFTESEALAAATLFGLAASPSRPAQVGCREFRQAMLCRNATTSTALDQFHAGAVTPAIRVGQRSDLLIMLTAAVQRRRSAHHGRHIKANTSPQSAEGSIMGLQFGHGGSCWFGNKPEFRVWGRASIAARR